MCICLWTIAVRSRVREKNIDHNNDSFERKKNIYLRMND